MLKSFGLIAIFLVVGLSFYLYKTTFKPIPEVPDIANALNAHFKEHGIQTEPRSIRHGYSDIEAHVSYEFKDYPLPISVSVCNDLIAANRHLKSSQNSPNLNFPTQNGRLVMTLIFWEESEFTTKVLDAFNSFNPST